MNNDLKSTEQYFLEWWQNCNMWHIETVSDYFVATIRGLNSKIEITSIPIFMGTCKECEEKLNTISPDWPVMNLSQYLFQPESEEEKKRIEKALMSNFKKTGKRTCKRLRVKG
jgi:hypothetical protein